MVTGNKPLKRHEALRPLSREHHEGLLFCWKIRTGLKNGVEFGRITDYASHFFRTHLLPHFREEEETVFPLLRTHPHLLERALNDHRRLRQLFDLPASDPQVMELTVHLLEGHIRFEERVLFELLQAGNGLDNLQHQKTINDPAEEWPDAFWLRTS